MIYLLIGVFAGYIGASLFMATLSIMEPVFRFVRRHCSRIYWKVSRRLLWHFREWMGIPHPQIVTVAQLNSMYRRIYGTPVQAKAPAFIMSIAEAERQMIEEIKRIQGL